MSTDRGMGKEDVVHTYNGILLSHKKNEIMPFAATWMDLQIIILSEVSQKEKDKYCMISLICGILKIQLVKITKKKQTHKYREQTSGYQWGEGRGGNIRVGY